MKLPLLHKHLIFRIETQTPPTDETFIANWMQNLISAIGMELYAGPFVKYLDEPKNRGATGVCIIKTSHIALHVWDEPNPAIMQLDVYTCGELKLEDVLTQLEVFKPSKVEYKFLDREHNLELLQHGIV